MKDSCKLWLCPLALAVLLALACGPATAVIPATSTPVPTLAPTRTPEQSAEYNDFDPGLGILALFVFAVILVLIGAGIVMALALLALAALAALAGAVLVGLGVVSTSVLVGFAERRLSAGFTALALQVGALAGLPFGIGGFWLVQRLLDLRLGLGWVALGGAVCGALSGAAVGLLFALACARVVLWGRGRLQAR